LSPSVYGGGAAVAAGEGNHLQNNYYLVIIMSPTALIFCIVVILIGFAAYHIFVSRKTIIKEKINGTPLKKISEVRDGEEVRIKGHIVLVGRTLVAPLSKKKCAYYSVEISNWDMLGPEGSSVNEQRAGDVVITDGENYALINVKKAEALLNHDEVHRYDSFTFNLQEIMTNSPELREYVEKRSKNMTLLEQMNIEVTASEGTLVEGELVSAAGKASWKPASQFRLNVPVKNILYIDALNEHGVYLTEDHF